jgi:tetratricopeptide (TPR) repeat protein
MIRPSTFYFTPSMNDPALLEAMFTARQPLAEVLLSRIRDSAETGNRHYSLLIGPRGIGKTHLVSLLNYRVKEDQSLHKRLRIAWLQEDPYAVSSYARLLRATLSQLDADYGVPGWKERLAAIEELALGSQVEAALERSLIDYLGERVLLLIAENLDAILEGLGDDGQKKLRAFLEAKSTTTILATSTSLLPDLDDRDGPLFGFFKKYPLAPFSLEDCLDVLIRIAAYRVDEPLEETLRLPQGRARIRAIHHIAGGNPRIYVIFYQFLSRESLDQLVEPFMHLVEELTPYYQARMQTLSAQQRTLIDIIRRNESPIAVRDIAKAAFITSQSASSDLKMLRDLGYVDSTQVGRESLYELREPLMRICLAAKEPRGQSLPLFVEFLRIWFTPAELKGLGSERVYQARDYDLYRDAIEESRRRADARASFEHEKILEHEVAGEEDLALARLRLWFEHAPDDLWAWYRLKELLEKRREIEELIGAAKVRTELPSADGVDWNELGYSYNLAGDSETALEASTRAIKLSPDEPVLWWNHLVNLGNLKRHADLIAAAANALEIKADTGNDDYWYLRARCFWSLGKPEESARAWISSILLKDDDYWNWGWLLASLDRLGARHSCTRVAEFAIDLFPENAEAWRGYGVALANAGAYQPALKACEKAIALSPEDKSLEGGLLCWLLQLNDLAGARASLQHFDVWRKSRPYPSQFRWKADLMLAIGDRISARQALVAYLDDLKARNTLGDADSPIAVIERTRDPSAWAPYISLWLEVFEEQGILAALGPALVRGVLRKPEVMTPAVARDWTRVWQQAAGESSDLKIPLRLMEVAVRFIETEDRSVLLDLPIEQRALLEPEIDRYLWASGKVRHEIDHEVDALLETVRQRRRAAAVSTAPPPVEIDSARIDSLLKTYDARRRPAASLRPLLHGNWASMPKKTAAALVRALANSGRKAAALLSRPGLTIRRLDQLALVFARGYLCQAHIDLNGRIGAFDFWSDGQICALLDGSSVPLHRLVRHRILDTSGPHQPQYLTFYCSALRSEGGRFEVVDPADAPLAGLVHATNPEITLMPPTSTVFEGSQAYAVHMIYRDQLSRAILRVSSTGDGAVDFLSIEPLTQVPGVRQESFDGPIRFWASDSPKKGERKDAE